MKHHESNLQIACVRWFKYLQYPEYANLLFAIPNGGKRNAREAANLKKEGVTPGVSDLFLSIPRGKYHGLYIEMKWKNNDLTAKQKEFFKDASEQGYATTKINDFNLFIETVENYLSLK